MKVCDVADPLWAAARGAALYARIRQEVAWNCMEPEGYREGIGDGKQAILVIDELWMRE